MNAAASTRAARVLSRLSSEDGVVAPTRGAGAYGFYPNGDRRRRPIGKASAAEIAALLAEGALERVGPDAFRITPAGRKRAARAAHPGADAFLAQHAPVVARSVVDGEGDVRLAAGLDPRGPAARLARWRDGAGAAFFTPAEIAAAQRLRADWEQGQIGLTPAADWRAPPRGSAARGAGGREGALAIGLDARARVAQALAALAPPLRAVATAAVLEDRAIAEIERAQRWPARSAKVALKLALAQLAGA
ncbi:MAG: DUF6456 domain-containing protein [Hyphomonadaceae bacterium]|nr:DUF6456 domain-containing protein [Hyphomonadaceae bacterium]